MRRVLNSLSEKSRIPPGKKILLAVVVTVIASELFMAGSIGPFRFSAGTAFFIFAALSLNHLQILPAGLLVGFSAAILRLAVEQAFFQPAGIISFCYPPYYSSAFGFLLQGFFSSQ